MSAWLRSRYFIRGSFVSSAGLQRNAATCQKKKKNLAQRHVDTLKSLKNHEAAGVITRILLPKLRLKSPSECHSGMPVAALFASWCTGKVKSETFLSQSGIVQKARVAAAAALPSSRSRAVSIPGGESSTVVCWCNCNSLACPSGSNTTKWLEAFRSRTNGTTQFFKSQHLQPRKCASCRHKSPHGCDCLDMVHRQLRTRGMR